MTDTFVQWVAVRPDTLREGDISEYSLHDGLVSSLFAPDSTNMANVAHFMCELATNSKAWDEWKGRLPVIINATRMRSKAAAVTSPADRAANRFAGAVGASAAQNE